MPTPKPIWIASYPKSGNTWVRFIVTSLQLGGIEQSTSVERVVQDVHKSRSIVLPKEGELFLKTHWKLSEQMPEIKNTKAAIYIVRNPLDVAASILSYLQVRTGEPTNSFVDEFVRFGGISSWRNERYGSWEENVESWVSSSVAFPRLLLRYEDLLLDTPGQVRRIAEFLGFNLEPHRIESAVTHTSFEKLRQLEAYELGGDIQGLFMYELHLKQRIRNATGPVRQFMNRGRAGNFLKVFSKPQNMRMLVRFVPTMVRAGYDVAYYQQMIAEQDAVTSEEPLEGSN